MINKSVLLYILFLTVLLYCKLNAQFKINFAKPDWKSEYSLDVWTKEDGLPSNSIYDILEDNDGFIWLGTSYGLVRFDGSIFKIFNSANTNQIKANVFRSIYQNASGEIWAANGGAGLLKIYKKKLKLFTIDNGLSLNHISSIIGDKSGKLYISTYGGGINIFQNGKFKHITTKDGLSSNKIFSLLIDKKGRFWAGTDNNGINLIDKHGIKKFGSKNSSSKFLVRQIFRTSSFGTGSKEKVLIATDKGVFVFNGKSFELDKALLTLKGKSISHIDEDPNGNLWFSTIGDGIYIYNGSTFVQLSKNNFLPVNDISRVLTTKIGVWICSKSGGLFLMKQNKIKMLTKARGLPSKIARTIFQDSNGVLWIGTNNGIAKYDEKKEKITKIESDIPNLDVRAWTTDTNGSVFLATKSNGVFKIVNDKLENIIPIVRSESKLIRSIKFSDDGTLWIGTNGGGIALWKNNKLRFINKSLGMPSNFIACIYKDKKNNFWVGTTGGGIVVLNNNGTIIKSFSEKDGLASNIVNSITQDENGIIWVATSVSGISRIKDGNIFNFNVKNGLYTNTIKKLLYDGNKRFWITSDRGIFSINKNSFNNLSEGKNQRLNFSLYGIYDEFNAAADNAGCISTSGKIYAPTDDGVVIINPNLFNKNKEQPKIFIDDVFIDYQKCTGDEFKNLSPNTGSIQINYTGISFIHQNNLKFKYLLEGINKNWTFVGKQRKAFFTHLPHGSYTFKVKAISPEGTESFLAAKVSFTILPYYWQTIWFRIISVFLFFTLITIYIFFYVKREYKRKLIKLEAESKLEKERLRISRDMHDELGASLTKILLLTDLAKINLKNNVSVEKDLDYITEASRNVALTLADIVWAVNPKNDTLEKTIYYLVQYIEEYLSATEIEFVIKIPDKISECFIHAELRQNLLFVIKEALNNVVKHSGASLFSFSVSSNNSILSVFLEDNGCGIDLANVNQFSNGLENMQKRVEELNGKFILSKNKPRGTVINIIIPIT